MQLSAFKIFFRKLARKHKNLYVCTGPLYLPKLESDGALYVKYKVIGRNNVAVPTHFFKVARGLPRQNLPKFLKVEWNE